MQATAPKPSDINPKGIVVAIELRFVPWYVRFRHNKLWWYNMPPDDDDDLNAVGAGDNVDMRTVPLDEIVAVHIDDLPKNAVRFGKIIY